MTNTIPPIFNEIQIRAKCPNDHSSFCTECEDTEYIERWVLICNGILLQLRSKIVNIKI